MNGCRCGGIQLPLRRRGIAMFNGELSAEQLYRRAFSAAIAARRKGKTRLNSSIRPRWKSPRRLMEEHDILTALDNHQFAIWLQPPG